MDELLTACGAVIGRHPQVRGAGVGDDLLMAGETDNVRLQQVRGADQGDDSPTTVATVNVRNPKVRGAGVEHHLEPLGWRPNRDVAVVLELQGQVALW